MFFADNPAYPHRLNHKQQLIQFFGSDVPIGTEGAYLEPGNGLSGKGSHNSVHEADIVIGDSWQDGLNKPVSSFLTSI